MLTAHTGLHADAGTTHVSRSTIDGVVPIMVMTRVRAYNTVVTGPIKIGIRVVCSDFEGDHLTIVGDGEATGIRSRCGSSACADADLTTRSSPV